MFAEHKQMSEDGFELTWAVNVVAPFLLQSLLLPDVRCLTLSRPSDDTGLCYSPRWLCLGLGVLKL